MTARILHLPCSRASACVLAAAVGLAVLVGPGLAAAAGTDPLELSADVTWSASDLLSEADAPELVAAVAPEPLKLI